MKRNKDEAVINIYSAKREKEVPQYTCPSKLSKRELEDLYFSTIRKNIELKKTIHQQDAKLKSQSTKLQRMINMQKNYINQGKKDCCAASKAVIKEQSLTIQDLQREVQKQKGQVQSLKTKMSSIQQFVKRPPSITIGQSVAGKVKSNSARSSIKYPSAATLASKSATGVKSGSAQNLDKINSPNDPIKVIVPLEVLTGNEPVKLCDENKCRNEMDELRRKIAHLEEELAKTHVEYTEKINDLEKDLSDLHAENMNERKERLARENSLAKQENDAAEMKKKLMETQNQCEQLSADLNIEKGKVAELQTQVKVANMTNEALKALEDRLNRENEPKDKENEQDSLRNPKSQPNSLNPASSNVNPSLDDTPYKNKDPNSNNQQNSGVADANSPGGCCSAVQNKDAEKENFTVGDKRESIAKPDGCPNKTDINDSKGLDHPVSIRIINDNIPQDNRVADASSPDGCCSTVQNKDPEKENFTNGDKRESVAKPDNRPNNNNIYDNKGLNHPISSRVANDNIPQGIKRFEAKDVENEKGDSKENSPIPTNRHSSKFLYSYSPVTSESDSSYNNSNSSTIRPIADTISPNSHRIKKSVSDDPKNPYNNFQGKFNDPENSEGTAKDQTQSNNISNNPTNACCSKTSEEPNGNFNDVPFNPMHMSENNQTQNKQPCNCKNKCDEQNMHQCDSKNMPDCTCVKYPDYVGEPEHDIYRSTMKTSSPIQTSNRNEELDQIPSQESKSISSPRRNSKIKRQDSLKLFGDDGSLPKAPIGISEYRSKFTVPSEYGSPHGSQLYNKSPSKISEKSLVDINQKQPVTTNSQNASDSKSNKPDQMPEDNVKTDEKTQVPQLLEQLIELLKKSASAPEKNTTPSPRTSISQAAEKTKTPNDSRSAGTNNHTLADKDKAEAPELQSGADTTTAKTADDSGFVEPNKNANHEKLNENLMKKITELEAQLEELRGTILPQKDTYKGLKNEVDPQETKEVSTDPEYDVNLRRDVPDQNNGEVPKNSKPVVRLKLDGVADQNKTPNCCNNQTSIGVGSKTVDPSVTQNVENGNDNKYQISGPVSSIPQSRNSITGPYFQPRISINEPNSQINRVSLRNMDANGEIPQYDTTEKETDQKNYDPESVNQKAQRKSCCQQTNCPSTIDTPNYSTVKEAIANINARTSLEIPQAKLVNKATPKRTLDQPTEITETQKLHDKESRPETNLLPTTTPEINTSKSNIVKPVICHCFKNTALKSRKKKSVICGCAEALASKYHEEAIIADIPVHRAAASKMQQGPNDKQTPANDNVQKERRSNLPKPKQGDLRGDEHETSKPENYFLLQQFGAPISETQYSKMNKPKKLKTKAPSNQLEICEESARICTCPQEERRGVSIFRSCSGSIQYEATHADSLFKSCSCLRTMKDYGTQYEGDNNKGDEPKTYTIPQSPEDNKCSRATSPDNTDKEISSLPDLPPEREDGPSSRNSNCCNTASESNSSRSQKHRRLSPGEDKTTTTTTTYTDTGTVPTSTPGATAISLSEGEMPQNYVGAAKGNRKRTSLMDSPTAKDKPSLDNRPTANMEQTLAAISEELTRCRLLLQNQPVEGNNVQMKETPSKTGTDSGIDLKSSKGHPHIGHRPTRPLVMFVLHIGTLVFSDEAMILLYSRSMSLVLTWQFFNQNKAMSHITKGRVVHFDFSTQYDLKLTDELLHYMDSVADPHRSPNDSEVEFPRMQDEMGVLDLWCLLRVDQRVMPRVIKALAKSRPSASV